MAAERREHVLHRIGIVAQSGEVADAEIVGLIFLRSRVTQSEIFGRLPGHSGQAFRAGDEPDGKDAQGPPEGPALLAPAMGGDDMADFVGEDRAELGFTVDDAHHAPGEIDVAAWNGEGVDDVAVDEGEGALAVEARGAGDPFPQPARVDGLRRIVAAAEFGQEQRMLLGSELGFLGKDDRVVEVRAAAAGDQETQGDQRRQEIWHPPGYARQAGWLRQTSQRRFRRPLRPPPR